MTDTMRVLVYDRGQGGTARPGRGGRLSHRYSHQVPDLAPFDPAFDAVGTTDTPQQHRLVQGAKGGTVCFVGLGLPEVTIPLFDVVVAERSIVGSFCYPDEVFKEAVGHIAEGRLNPEPYLGAIECFEDIGAAFEELATGIRTEAKILMTTNAAPPEVPT